MKRWLMRLGIGGYLLALVIGILSHTLGVGTGAHPLMYFVVWDMFCGWSAYEAHTQFIGEGESGKYYELGPGPWGDFHPFGRISRQHYDPYAGHGPRMAMNCLKHTKHEPMTRIFVLEENAAKKYNIPDDQYLAYYGKPKNVHHYFHTRFIMNPEGQITRTLPTWLLFQYELGLNDNPRMMADSRKNRPFFSIGSDLETRGRFTSGPFAESPFSVHVSSPLAE